MSVIKVMMGQAMNWRMFWLEIFSRDISLSRLNGFLNCVKFFHQGTSSLYRVYRITKLIFPRLGIKVILDSWILHLWTRTAIDIRITFLAFHTCMQWDMITSIFHFLIQFLQYPPTQPIPTYFFYIDFLLFSTFL